jgi:hypothetical protein
MEALIVLRLVSTNLMEPFDYFPELPYYYAESVVEFRLL